MQVIGIDPAPNQSFSVTIDGNRWDFVIKQAVTSMFADITLNDLRILSGQRIVAGTPLIPYELLQGAGNFVLLTADEELPNWERFGIDQVLVYASVSEIEEARA